jgi:hypothetical protein
MTLTAVSVVVAGLLLIAFLAVTISRSGRGADWTLPALLSAALAVFSAWTIAAEGPAGFWSNHASNLWGNQVWFDLILSLGLGWALILPRARALRMRLVPWAVLLVATGSIGLFALVARVLWLEGRRA